jgi:predicted SnoaL-like aldol condensation-catalyzing enzyme
MNNPKDKAGDLIVKFIKHSRAEKDIKPIDSAKQCALILVDETIQHNCFVSTGIKQSIYDYWQEVKTEINNL